jgi:hypothetical protein
MKKDAVGAGNLFMFDVSCTHCNASNTAPDSVCASCGHVIPFYTMNPFVVFRIAPTLQVDPGYRDQTYFTLQRLLHPDKLANATVTEATWAEQHISQVNQSYKVLKQPILAAKAAVLYAEDPRLPLDQFDNARIPMPSMDFLQHMMMLQAEPSPIIETLYNEIIQELLGAVSNLEVETILNAIARLTYVERLRNLL